MRRGFLDCGESPVFVRPRSPDQIVFVAKAAYAGCSHAHVYIVCRWALDIVPFLGDCD